MIRLFMWFLLLGLQQAKVADSLPKGALARCGGAGFRHEGGSVGSVVFSPNGKMIASSGDMKDRTLRVWDAASGRELQRVTSERPISCIGFSADGKSVISYSEDRAIRFWEIATGRELRKPEAPGPRKPETPGPRTAPALLSRDGMLIASVESGKAIHLSEAESGREIRKIEATATVPSLAFSPDGKSLAASCQDMSKQGPQGITIRVWEVASAKELWKVEGEKALAVSVAFSSDGKILATGGHWDPIVRLWEAASGKLVREIRIPTTSPASTPGLAFSPDGKLLVTGDSTGWLRFWDPSTGREIRGIKSETGWLASVAFSPDGALVAAAGHGRTVRVWDAATGKDHRKAGNDEVVYSVAFSPDSKSVVTGSNQIRRWDAATGNELQQPVFRGDADRISLEPTLVGISSDGKTVASACYTTVRIWEAATGKEKAALKPPIDGAIKAMALSPDGKHVAIGTPFKNFGILEAASGNLLLTLPGIQEGVSCMAYSPDGKLLATGSQDNSIMLWELASGRSATTLSGHAKPVNSVAFTPDGKLLASASQDQTLRLWNVASRKEVLAIQGETPFRALAISPDGRLLASGGNDGVVRLWDVPSGKETGKFSGHEGSVLCLSFSPDGKMLASGSADMTTLLWKVAP